MAWQKYWIKPGAMNRAPTSQGGDMSFNPAIHHRKSIRLRDYDYSQAGWYFITICTHQRQLLFGEIVDGRMVLNAAGMIVEKVWNDLPDQYPYIQIKEFVVMPNHFHGIVQIVGAQFIAPKNSGVINHGAMNQGAINCAPTGLGQVARAFKARCTWTIRHMLCSSRIPIWQRNYYEHVIRDEAAYLQIAEYIQTNPQRWQEDTYHP
jgi:putative transposase